MRCLKRARRDGATVSAAEEANARYFAEVMRRRYRRSSGRTVTANSYYFDKNGDVPLRPTNGGGLLAQSAF